MDALIPTLYDAVGNDTALGDVLDAMRLQLQAQTLVLVSTRISGTTACKHILARGVPASSLVEYEHHFHKHDVWVNAAVRLGLHAGLVTCGDELVTRDELQNSYFWHAFLKRYGTLDALSALIECPPEAEALTFVTFHRGPGQARFGPSEKDRLRQWQPHLAIALRQHRRLAPQLAFGQSLGQVFEACQQPLLVLSAQGTVKDHNPALQRWQALASSLVRVNDQGQLALALSGTWVLAADALQQVLWGEQSHAKLDLKSADGRETARLLCHTVEATFMEPTATREWGALVMVEGWEPEHLAPKVQVSGVEPGVVMAARAQEQQRIMQDLHDGLGHHLVGLRSMLEQLDKPPHTLINQVDAALDEMRLVVDALSPEGRDLATLLGMLRHRLSRRMAAAGLTLTWDMPPIAATIHLSPEEARHVQRIVLEALTNTIKHAQARVVGIKVRQGPKGAEVVVSDDGLGLPNQEASQAVGPGRGIQHMRNRAAWIGAKLTLAPGPGGHGTVVRLQWPRERQIVAQHTGTNR